MTNRDKNVALAKRLQLVRTNGDAWAFSIQALRDARATSESLGKYVDPASVGALEMMTNAIHDVSINLDPFTGSDDTPVSAASWKELRGAIGRLYALWWAIEDVIPESERLTPWELWATLAVELPAAVIEQAGDMAGELANKAAAGATNVVWQFIKGAWPILLAGAVVLGGGIYLAATGRAVLPGVKVST